ncbi:MAG TPA: MBL fold metallo-hydrolase [Solirubrobacteraceae bacterium]|nr:MBL fold metallo-hydrolase [Solirubrobacteraceae bacterium]
MKLKVWGARGSIPAPGPETMRYGGNTSCAEVTLSDGSTLILDAGTGIRNLGLALPRVEQPVHILLTHLHLDHIQGLMFFAPCFRPESEIVIWGPASPEASLRDRIARYISAPLAPVEVRELPSLVSFREADVVEWEIGPARIRAESVSHRGPTLGYRIEDAGTSLCYIPDHEPGLGAPLDGCEDQWISGFDLARGADLLVHDCQYTDEEYRQHLGWGHCPVSDALAFGRRVEAQRMLLFHHDPLHSDDFLDSFGDTVNARWHELGGPPGTVQLAAERHELSVERAPVRATA